MLWLRDYSPQEPLPHAGSFMEVVWSFFSNSASPAQSSSGIFAVRSRNSASVTYANGACLYMWLE